jgi:competence protein ComEC
VHADSLQTPPPAKAVNRQPLVLGAALLLAGAAAGAVLHGRGGGAEASILAAALLLWATWATLEHRGRGRFAGAALAGAILLSGLVLWQLDQNALERSHIASFLPTADDELPITLRVRIDAVEEAVGDHQAARCTGQVQSLLTTRGWIPATGQVLINWTGGDPRRLSPGELAEIYGWLKRPDPPRNPGGIDRRKQLAADRIFAEVRVPRAAGLVQLQAGYGRAAWLDRFRGFLRGKLLQHTVREDVPAAYTLTALILGTRDPAMRDVSQSFADAGVAHLLAISGSHIVFFAGLAWGLLRLLPLRPRPRELLIALIVLAYVLATPCNPPVIRAAIALVLVVIARLVGRPREYLNMLAAAAILVLLLRPTDLLDAGCQLSFVSTAGLILLAERLYHGWFGPWLERESLVADLAGTPWARRRIAAYRFFCGLLVANAIGAATAAPLVALHFGQVNLWAVLAGLVALPVVSVGMVVGALQLLLELLSTTAASWFSPLSILVGKAMIWIVARLAQLPGSAVAVRPPPSWLIALMYAVLLLWIFRRRFGLSRAAVVNAILGIAALTAAWYAFTQPVNALRFTLLDAGPNASSVIARLPGGELWLLDAGVSRGSSATALLAPALRLQGTRRFAGIALTALDPAHAGGAGEAIRAYDPRQVLLSQAQWDHRGETFSGIQLERAAGARVSPLSAPASIAFRDGTRIDILWPPPPSANPTDRTDLILLWHFAGKSILTLDPRADGPLALALLSRPALRCDVVLFLGNQRGTADEPLRRLIAPLAPRQILWAGRGPWSPKTLPPNESNAADGATTLFIDSTGSLHTVPLSRP